MNDHDFVTECVMRAAVQILEDANMHLQRWQTKDVGDTEARILLNAKSLEVQVHRIRFCKRQHN